MMPTTMTKAPLRLMRRPSNALLRSSWNPTFRGCSIRPVQSTICCAPSSRRCHAASVECAVDSERQADTDSLLGGLPSWRRDCPCCVAETVRVLANFDDCLTACRCPRCRGVFYTILPQFDAPAEPEPARPARRGPACATCTEISRPRLTRVNPPSCRMSAARTRLLMPFP